MIELQALSVNRIRQPEKRWVLLQTGDETLDYSQASAYYRRCKTVIEYGGDHSFQNFARWLPAITDFLIIDILYFFLLTKSFLKIDMKYLGSHKK